MLLTMALPPLPGVVQETTTLSLHELSQSAKALLSGVDWSNPSWSLLVLAFGICATFLYGFTLGKTRLLLLMVSVYMSLAVTSGAPLVVPLLREKSHDDAFFLRVSIFLGVFLLLFILLSRTRVGSAWYGDGPPSWWQLGLLSVLQVGLLISVILSLLPADAAPLLAPFTRTLFVVPLAQFLWMVVPILAIALVG